MIQLGIIVEGKGEIEALPVLIRRIADKANTVVEMKRDWKTRVPSSSIKATGGLEREIKDLANRLGSKGGIIVLLDCDDGCPAREGPELLSRAKSVRNDLPITVILAKKEFEGWFIAAAESLKGKHGLADDLAKPTDRNPENIRGAKQWIGDHMPKSTGYAPTLHQAKLTYAFNMDLARRNSDSFDKCYREIEKIITLLKEQAQE